MVQAAREWGVVRPAQHEMPVEEVIIRGMCVKFV